MGAPLSIFEFGIADTVQLSLMIGATGEVAICGTLKGGISGQTSLLLTLKRKQKTT